MGRDPRAVGMRCQWVWFAQEIVSYIIPDRERQRERERESSILINDSNELNCTNSKFAMTNRFTSRVDYAAPMSAAGQLSLVRHGPIYSSALL